MERAHLLFVSLFVGLPALVPFTHGAATLEKRVSINQDGKLRKLS